MAVKAKFLGESNDVTCILCFLIKSQNPKVKYYLTDEGSFYNPKDTFICQHCLEWTKEIRKKCEDQCKHPEEDKFDNITFWHDPKREEKSAIEVKESAIL